MNINFLESLQRNYLRTFYYYRLWFTLYADPLSDDILSDIHEQAMTWATSKLEAETA